MRWLALGALAFTASARAAPAVASAGAASFAVEAAAEPQPLRLAALLGLALAPPFCLGLWLALRRAWLADPLHAARRARRVLRRLSRRSSVPEAGELQLWRDAVIALWRVPSAAPTAAEIACHAGAGWAELWSEAELKLYGRERALAPDWSVRARAAIDAVRLPGRFSRLPRAVRMGLPLAALMLLAGIPVLPAAEPTAGMWHRSRARELAAEEKWDAAHAHWLAAFAADPNLPEVAGGLRDSLGRVPAADPALQKLLLGKWHERIGAWCPPRQWARLAWSASALFALFACGWLALAHAGALRSRVGHGVCGAAALIAAAAMALGCRGFRSYGPLTNPQVACIVSTAEVRPIPSEVGASAPRTLRPGALVIVDRSFLGWDHVVSGDAQLAGWLRSEHAIWIYRARDATRVSRSYPDARPPD